MNALAELYIAGRQFDKALELYLQQGAKCTNSAHVFELVEQHELWESARQHVRPLVLLAPDMAVAMLVGHIDSVPATEVVQQLHGQREFQHKYLDSLFHKERDEYCTEAYAALHELQVRSSLPCSYRSALFMCFHASLTPLTAVISLMLLFHAAVTLCRVRARRDAAVLACAPVCQK